MKSLSRVRLFATPRTVACLAPIHGILQARILEWVAMPSSGDLLDPGIEPVSPTLQANSLPSEPPGTEIDVFLELFCFFNDPADVGNLISGSSAFSSSSLNIWKFMVCVLLKPGLENFKHTSLACEMSAIVR